MTIQEEAAQHKFWYHELELSEGFTVGGRFPHSVPATRSLLKSVNLEGVDCLDIGAMDGLFSILACRRGAGRVIATDRYDFSERVNLVKRAFRVDFEYVPGMPLAGTRRELKRRWGKLADVVIFSGVLYHMFDPMGGLARVRGLVRRNGLVLVETIAVVDDDSIIHYDDDFSIYGPSTYQIPTTAALGSMLRFVGLEPIDVRYFTFGRIERNRLCRIAVCCRAGEPPVLAKNPPWYARGEHEWYAEYARGDFGEFLDLDEALADSGMKEVGYRCESGFVSGRDPDMASPLPMATFYNLPGMKVRDNWTRLGQNDVY